MTVLAIESSAKAASVAVTAHVAEVSVLLGQYFQNSGLTHSKTLMSMTESLLKNLGLHIYDIGLAAVASGPGSFTGVRIGVSAVKGLAWGANIPVCGVSTLKAMAYQLQGFSGIICPVMDARRNQVYNALFEWQDGNPKRICADRAISLEELSLELRSCEKPITLIGDGTDLTAEYLRGVNIKFDTAPILLRNQTAYGVALAATVAAASEPVSAINLEPFYLRPSQAEREACKSTI